MQFIEGSAIEQISAIGFHEGSVIGLAGEIRFAFVLSRVTAFFLIQLNTDPFYGGVERADVFHCGFHAIEFLVGKDYPGAYLQLPD